MTTGGGFLFSASLDGRFFALDAETGAMLWEVQSPPGPATPITYELDGQQYVTILSGPGGDEGPAGVWTFVLDGTAALPASGSPTP